MKKKGIFRFRDHYGKLSEAPIRWYDFLILGTFMLFCFLSYTMRDILHTAGCSYGYLDGHIFDFYDYLAAYGIDEGGGAGLHASYMPTVYLIFAVWNLPMKLFGVVPKATAVLGILPVMWAKVLPCLVFLAGGFVVLLIAKELGMADHKAKLVMYAYISMPVALYGQFILGQYESFIVFCVLLGVYNWLKKRHVQFVIWFSIALTFKITALLFFIPLVLLREKNIWKILLSCAAVFVLYGLEFLIYRGSPTFLSYAFGIGTSGDNPTGYIFNAAYFTGYILTENLKYEVYLAVLAFAGVCAYAYFKNTVSPDEEKRYAMFILCLTGAALFAFSKWHPHWLMIVVPFWTITAFMHRDTKIWMVLDLLFTALFIMFCTGQFIGVADEVMLSKGIFKFLLPGGVPTVKTQMIEYLGKFDMSVELSLLTAMILIFAAFKHPKFMTSDLNVSADKTIGWIRARYMIGLLIFILPSLLVVKDSVGDQRASYLEEVRARYVSSGEGDFTVSQSFVSEGSVSKIKFPVSMGNNTKEGTLVLSLLSENGEILYTEAYDMKNFYEGKIVMAKPGIVLPEDENVEVRFEASGLNDGATFALLGNGGGTQQNAYLNGEETDYHLNINIYR